MPGKPDPPRYSAAQVAHMLGITRQSVHYHTRRLGVGQQIGRSYAYSDKDVLAIRLHTREGGKR